VADNLDWKIFGTLFFSMFATITGVGIVVPLLPVYAHDLGATGFYVAMIFGAFSLSRTIFLPYFGKLSDLNGRKPFIVGGLFAYVLISIAFIFFNSVDQLIFLRLIQGIASAMIMPVVQAYVGEISPKGKEGLMMGGFNTSLFAALSLGPMFGGMLNDHVNLEAAFICMGLLALLGYLLSSLFLPPRHLEKISVRRKDPIAWWYLVKDRTISGLFAFRFAYTTCIGIIWGFLPLFADVNFSLSSSKIGILIMLSVMISGITQVPMGYLADQIGHKRFVTLGGLVICLAMGAFNWADGFFFLLVASIVFGLGGGIAMPALMAMSVRYGGLKKSMGSVMALLTMAHSLGMLVGSLLAGFMMDFFELHSAFLLGTVVMLLGWGCFIFLIPKTVATVKRPTLQTAIKVKL
jgi:DHA1 family multidrug resistance protein-like MFS transporter